MQTFRPLFSKNFKRKNKEKITKNADFSFISNALIFSELSALKFASESFIAFYFILLI